MTTCDITEYDSAALRAVWYRDSALDRSTFTADGRMRTDDPGHSDQNGSIAIADRIKGVITSCRRADCVGELPRTAVGKVRGEDLPERSSVAGGDRVEVTA